MALWLIFRFVAVVVDDDVIDVDYDDGDEDDDVDGDDGNDDDENADETTTSTKMMIGIRNQCSMKTMYVILSVGHAEYSMT